MQSVAVRELHARSGGYVGVGEALREYVTVNRPNALVVGSSGRSRTLTRSAVLHSPHCTV